MYVMNHIIKNIIYIGTNKVDNFLTIYSFFQEFDLLLIKK